MNADIGTAEILFRIFKIPMVIILSTFMLHFSKESLVLIKKNRERNRIRNRTYALHEMENMSHRDFKRMFRMSKVAFQTLEMKIEPFMKSTNIAKAVNSSGSYICLTTKLAVTIDD